MTENFYIENKVYYHDTDAGGVVYYGRYMDHLEEGRNEFLRHKGIDLSAYAKKEVLFAVVRAEVDYKSPARYGDKIKIFTSVEKVGVASAQFLQEIKIGETVLVKARVVLACISGEFRAQAIPEEIRRALGGD